MATITINSNSKRFSYYRKTSKKYTSIRKAKKAYKKTYWRFLEKEKVETHYKIHIKHRNKDILYKVYFCKKGTRQPYID